MIPNVVKTDKRLHRKSSRSMRVSFNLVKARSDLGMSMNCKIEASAAVVNRADSRQLQGATIKTYFFSMATISAIDLPAVDIPAKTVPKRLSSKRCNPAS